MDIIILILALINLFLLVFAVFVMIKIVERSNNSSDKKGINEIRRQIDVLSKSSEAQNKLMLEQSVRMSESLVYQISNLGGELRKSQESLQSRSVDVLEKIENDMKELDKGNRESLEKLRHDNSESLEKINETVNEKLQKTLNDRISQSFEAVNKRLAEVYEGLGEMKTVASGVSDLKKVLSNVKTRGIMGEIQLGAILSEILSPEQYCEQTAVVPGVSERVDFAVRLPGAADETCVYLPIDAKFPGDTYSEFTSAYEAGDAARIKAARNALEAEMKRCAKSIRSKYVRPPYTTDFAVMFLPFEGLYAEVVNMGLVEYLQREYKVSIAGPSTMAAMLNSLQMGFRTLAIQKKSGEVWKILEDAKLEFGKFEEVLESARNRLRLADRDLEALIGTRTTAINRSLKNVAMLENKE